MLPRLALAVVVFLSVPSSAYQLRKDSQGDVVRWPSRVEFVIDSRLVDALGEGKADAAVKAAIETMELATPGCEVRVRVGRSTGVGYEVGASDNQNDVLALEDWPYDGNALAATVVTLDSRTNTILDADIVFNAQNHHFRVVDALSATERGMTQRERFDDIQNTVTHEFGHALGLLHNEQDPAVVMYPSAAPLEISKRILASDDQAGLLALYETSLESPASILGCSSSGGAPLTLALLGLLGLGLGRGRRRRAALALLVAVPMATLAAEPVERFAPDLARADEVAVAQVRSMSSRRLPEHPRLLVTDVELEVYECVKGPCAPTRVVRVPGGRLGDLEQVVAHEPVPALDERILLVRTGRAPRVLKVSEPSDRALVRFAFERARLALPVSLTPQVSRPPPASTAQPPGFAR
jgi:MYXO-CTERM domain-containing protein